MPRYSFVKVLFFLVLLVLVPKASTAEWTFDGNGNWNNDTNWDVSFPNGVDAIAEFLDAISANRNVTLGQDITVGTLHIDDNNRYHITGTDTLTFDMSAGNAEINITATHGNGSHRISCPINLQDTITVSQGSTGVFELNGATGQVSGTGGITKTGTNTLRVNVRDNIYTGITTINQGTFEYRQRGAIPNGSHVIINGGTLLINRSMSTPSALVLTLNGGTLQQGSNQIVRLVSLTGSGQINITTNSQLFEMLGSGGSYTFDGVISGGVRQIITDPNAGSRFLKSGNSTLTLTAASDYKCRTYVGSGSQINIEHNNAIGDDTVNNGSSALTLDGGTYALNAPGLILTKDFQINGLGVSNLGAIRNITGSNELQGSIEIGWFGGSVNASPAGIGVDNMTSLDLSGMLLGLQELTKIGLGTLTLSGAVDNPFFGQLTVNQGTVRMAKSAGNATSGPVVINPAGVVILDQPNQIHMGSTVTIDGGSFNLNGNTETIGELVFNNGTLNQGGALLELTSLANALTMRNTTISGPIQMTGGTGGDIVFDASANGSAFVQSIDLGSTQRTFSIQNGTAAIDMEVANTTSLNTGISKSGPGYLLFSGTHNHTGGISIVDAGTLTIDGIFNGDILVNAGGKLQGNGQVEGATLIEGSLKPGSSIGTITVIGDLTFSPGSTYNVEVNPMISDLAQVDGDIFILNNTTLQIDAEPGLYSDETIYTILTSTGNVSGEFANLTHNFPLLIPIATHLSNEVQIHFVTGNFSDEITKGNPGKVAICLDHTDPQPGSGLSFIYSDLRMLTHDQLKNALDQMQPSMLKGLALAQENNAFSQKEMIVHRLLLMNRQMCHLSSHSSKSMSLWGEVMGDFYHQNNAEQNPSFRSRSANLIFGYDAQLSSKLLLGCAGGYSYSDLKWGSRRGEGEIQSGYISLYGGGIYHHFFTNLIFSGSYNYYHETRHIQFPDINRHARSHFNGGECLGHIDLGGIFPASQSEISPFISFDFIYLHQQAFSEQGAQSLNLRVDATDYTMARTECGTYLSRCSAVISASLKLSYIREDRFHGAHYSARLKDTSCTFNVKGMNPHRNLFSPALSLTYTHTNELIQISCFIEAEVGKHFWRQNTSLQGIFNF